MGEIFLMKSKLLIMFIIVLCILLLQIFYSPTAGALEMITEEFSGIQSDLPIGESLTLSLEDAVLLTLKRNRDLRVKILEPKIKKTIVEENKAAFDLNVSTKLNRREYQDSASWTKDEVKADLLSRFPNLPEDFFDEMPENLETKNTTQTNDGTIRLSKLFSTGTKLKLELKSQHNKKETTRTSSDEDSSSVNSTSSTDYTTSGSLTLTQPLLQGMGKKVNLSLIQRSELEKQVSVYELQQYIMFLVAKVQKIYWDLILAKETLIIRQKSLELVNQQLLETEEKIRIGKLAESELISAQAEVAAEKEELIDAVSDLDQKKLDFILLLNPETDLWWDQNIQLTTPPEPIETEIGVIQNHVAASLKFRPDLNQARLNLQKGDLEVVRTENGLLPRLDFFFTLKRTAHSSRFPSSLDEFDNPDYMAGLIFSRPLGNREAKNQFQRAGLQRLKYLESMEYLKQKIQVEVRQAILKIERYREQIIASRANRKKQEEKLKVEKEKFRLGRSTNLMVFHAQRDLIEAEVKEVTAIIKQIKAFIDLQLAEGTLLEQWSLEVIPPLANSL